MISKLVLGDLKENCYIITKTNQKECLIIDPGCGYKIIEKFLQDNKLKPLAVLLTHGHFDHCASCKKFQANQIPIYIHKDDYDKTFTDKNYSKECGYNFEKFRADYTFSIEELVISNFVIKIIETPGHSKGSVCFVYKNNIFTGDTVFEIGYGRTDLYDGSMQDLRNSIKKLTPYIQGDFYIFCGH